MGTIDALDDRKAHQVVYQIHFNLPASSAIHLIITDFRKKKMDLLVLMYIQKVIIRSARIAVQFFSIQSIFSEE